MKCKSTLHQISTENSTSLTTLAAWQGTVTALMIMFGKPVAKLAILLFVVDTFKTNPQPCAAHFIHNAPMGGSRIKSELSPSNAIVLNDEMIPSMSSQLLVKDMRHLNCE